MKRKAMKATRAINRMSSIWMPSKPSPMNMEASRPPAAIPASGPSQREAPLAAAAGRAALGAAAVAFGAVAGCAWRVWWLGAEPRLLPPPKRLALASRLTVSARQKARAMLRTRCIVVFLSWGIDARHVAAVRATGPAGFCFGLLLPGRRFSPAASGSRVGARVHLRCRGRQACTRIGARRSARRPGKHNAEPRRNVCYSFSAHRSSTCGC